jgi:hypothetical protein
MPEVASITFKVAYKSLSSLLTGTHFQLASSEQRPFRLIVCRLSSMSQSKVPRKWLFGNALSLERRSPAPLAGRSLFQYNVKAFRALAVKTGSVVFEIKCVRKKPQKIL